MALTYKVTYFDITGLAETQRFLLSYGGIEFEDERVPVETWSSVKSKTPFGQLPTLEYKGKVAHQSIAISRYLAKQVKLVGKDDWEDLEIDAVVDTIMDLCSKIRNYFYEGDPVVKAAKKEPLLKDILPYYLGKFDAEVKQNGYFAVGKLTWADFLFVAILDYLNVMVDADITADYPNLSALKKRVLELPSIKAWREKCPPKAWF